MKELYDKILKEGKICPGDIVKVDSFLNHQVDVNFMERVGAEFYNLFKDSGINKIVSIETSGVIVAMEVAKLFDCRLVFAKKGKPLNQDNSFYESKVMSYTRHAEVEIRLAKEYLTKDDKVLVIDDFLANGSAINGLLDIINQSGATLIGCGVVIEKGFQPGGKALREKGIRLESLAIIDEIDVNKQTIKFRK